MIRLDDQPWLKASATRAVMAALEAAGGPGCARFVGGCVRNALIGAPVADIDIATTLKPEETDRAIRAAGLKSVPTGIAHGTVTAVSERQPFEITTLRRDVSTDGRNATVAFTDDWAEDAARRDFRLNALYADGEGRVFDPTGEGVADAAAGRIVFVGDPETRIREDYLRILRFFRFFAWYGRGEPDEAALKACRELAPGMTRLSAERVSKELMTLLAAPDPLVAMAAMTDAGVLAQILPEAANGPLFEAAVGLSADPVIRLMTLFPTDERLVREASARLRFSNATRDRLAAAAAAAPAVRLTMSDPEVRAAVYRHGARTVADAVYRRWAESPEGADAAQRLLALAESWRRPSMPVGGRELARLGVEPGPETGRLLKAFEDGWIADDFPSEGHAERLAALVRP
ncbi:poly(A) polymerase/tRNA-nucleotidyltransferase [Brevundimonas denitrificans]|uniref:Poly(A) polymerase/tRNA-nucleotidyltransferase n=2 Tax=Brevundimonas denitrificans TaxID=1443434 RepID=A0ABQ6BFC7_9CAUL|nr:CCA tRNA nucleotidyltransferase [Brevundimonas denitrificans]GLS00730.1 poly(A) polymerase/tRNA-nucleotidyltransferase [Brevundimonas denitrificans]